MSCPFCSLIASPDRALLHESPIVTAFHDAFPVNPGHALVVPNRHVGHFADLTAVETSMLWTVAKRLVQVGQDYTIGINDGPLAGQTVPHLHLHIIPRFAGDVPDSRGGIRWVIPDKADYWSNR